MPSTTRANCTISAPGAVCPCVKATMPSRLSGAHCAFRASCTCVGTNGFVGPPYVCRGRTSCSATHTNANTATNTCPCGTSTSITSCRDLAAAVILGKTWSPLVAPAICAKDDARPTKPECASSESPPRLAGTARCCCFSAVPSHSKSGNLS